MVDVGGTNGALVVATPEWLDGAEIEIRATGTPWRGTHTAIRRRDLPGSVAYAGVFGTLPAGHYELRLLGSSGALPSDRADLPVTVVAGQVVHVDWPDETDARRQG